MAGFIWDGPVNLVSGTWQGLKLIARYLPTSPGFWTTTMPDLVLHWRDVQVQAETVRQMGELVWQMMQQSAIDQAIANGRWDQVPHTLCHEMREVLRLGAELRDATLPLWQCRHSRQRHR
ncbi:MAG: hypothetical protein NZT92_08660 [Abditibacteriales bacterium]|nr:hypothetical protein [Abditibacteriales bacterium]MDW8366161.1 hypothetical protein [Abditibacteriales bacterium]